ncbi:MAG: hypothetical protein JWN34_197 [Bryobacterales bacterium]|nr:hypothetical protein [Bryobacterales bacterium]
MSRSLEELRQSQFHQELGRKMCAAYVAQQQGTALETAYRKADPIGDLWLHVAEFARHGCSGSMDQEHPSAADQ